MWGEHDCSLFACDAVRAITGTDIAADFRRKYATERGALRVMKEFVSSADLGDVAGERGREAGMEEITNPLQAQRGDVVLVQPNSDRKALGIVGLDARFAYCVAEVGYVKYPTQYWKRAWRVG